MRDSVPGSSVSSLAKASNVGAAFCDRRSSSVTKACASGPRLAASALPIEGLWLITGEVLRGKPSPQRSESSSESDASRSVALAPQALHVQLLPEVEPDGLLEYEGHVLHEEEPEKKLYVPEGQDVQFQLDE